MSWFTKHRPRNIADLDLESVKEQFQSLMKSGTFPQTFLFAGPKGTGKTSTARIIGAMLNEPKNDSVVDYQFFGKKKPKNTTLNEPNPESKITTRICSGTSFVVNEMDAASNRGIDDIRSLKERIFLPPQEGKITVYILDEVHMLTTEAFNALLKILEEPPQHVVFILATTELHKVPETIQSRCSLIAFRKASTVELLSSMETVLKKESISFEKEALELIAQFADGSFRDAVKNLEIIAATTKKVTLEAAKKHGLLSYQQQIKLLVQYLLDKDEQSIVSLFSDLRENQVSDAYFYKQLISFLHQQLMHSITSESSQTIASKKILHFILSQLLRVEGQNDSPVSFLPLELKILEMVFKSKQKNGGKSGKKKKQIKSFKEAEHDQNQDDSKISSKTEVSSPDTSSHILDSIQNQEECHEFNGDGSQLVAHWDSFLQQLHHKNTSLELLLRSARPVTGTQGKAVIEVFYAFHKEQLQQPKFLSIIEDCMHQFTGGSLQLEFVMGKKADMIDDVSIGPVSDDPLLDMAKEILV